MTEKIKDCLSLLYSPDEINYAYERIVRLVDLYHKRIARPQETQALFSEKDVILITYGDSLKRPGENPLRALHKFADERLSGSISGAHILPFFPYSSDDGFSILDYYRVNPELGDWDEIRQIVAKFDLMIDAVLNHMSAQSEWFQKFLADDPDFRGLFRIEAPDTELSTVVRPRAHPLLTPFKKKNGETIYVWTTFSPDQVDFDLRYPDTLLRLLDILLFYVEKGARFIRLDAIAYLWKSAGTPSIHLPQTHTVIQLIRAILDVIAPHVILITETNVPHQENISYFGDGSNEAQMIYNFTLPPLLFHTITTGNTKKLRGWVNSLSTPTETTTFFNFTASHDGIGMRPVEGILNQRQRDQLLTIARSRGGRISYKQNPDGSKSPYELNISYVDAICNPDESIEMQARCFLVSQAIQLALAGVPGIYIHSLLGSRNDHAGVQKTGQNRAINREKLSLDRIEKELSDAANFRSLIFEPFLHLIRQRIRQPAFHPNATQQAIDIGNDGVFVIIRANDNLSERIIGLHNITNKTHYLDLSALMTAPAQDIITDERVTAKTMLAPYQIRWLKIEPES